MTVFNTNNKPEKATDVRFASKRQKTQYEKAVEQAVQEAVDAGIPTNGVPGQVLTRTLTLWEWADAAGGAGVDYTGATTGQVFSFNGTTGYWRDENTELPATGTAGNVLTDNGTDWISSPPATELPTIGSVGDQLRVGTGPALEYFTPDAGVVTATGQAADTFPVFDGADGVSYPTITVSSSAAPGGTGHTPASLWIQVP